MYKVAVMGDRDSIYGFGAVGLDVYPVADEEQGKTVFRRLVHENCAVIYITEALAAQLEEEIKKYEKSPLPAVILIPGISGNTGKGMESVSRSVERAVGSNLLSD